MESNILPISIVISSANIHDSAKFMDIMKSILDFLDYNSIKQIVSCFADKCYDAKYIRNYLISNDIGHYIPYKNNSKIILQNNIQNNGYNNKTRFVVEGFFAWLKNGFHRIRYEKNCDNYRGQSTLHHF